MKKWRKVTSELRRLPKFPIIILTAAILAAVFASLISPYSPLEGSLSERLKPPAWVEGGSPAHLLGTDFLGRDILSRLIFGTRISLTVALLSVLVAGTIGSMVGLVSGYFGGRTDTLLMRLTDIGLSIPMMLMAIILVAVLGASLFNVIVVIVVLLWPYYARQIRGEVLGIREQDFVALASVAGCSPIWIIRRHIIPNVLPTFLVLATLQVGLIIILEASLSFLGVGIPPPTPAWGLMVAEGQGLIASAWWIALWPGLAIFLTVLAANLMGDWIRDRLDPKLRQI